jgi:hypothetical protein
MKQEAGKPGKRKPQRHEGTKLTNNKKIDRTQPTKRKL